MVEPTMEFQIFVPAEHAAGTYANLLTAWYGEHEFTLDFSVMLPPMQADDGAPAVVICPVVSRLKVPVTVLFEMLQTINGTMTEYEDRFGRIRRAGEGSS